jgi:hypothetical protein
MAALMGAKLARVLEDFATLRGTFFYSVTECVTLHYQAGGRWPPALRPDRFRRESITTNPLNLFGGKHVRPRHNQGYEPEGRAE